MTIVNPPPWQGKELSYGARLGLMLLGALVLIAAIVSFFIVFGVSLSLLGGTVPPGSITADVIAIMVATVVCIASVGGLLVIWPYLRGPARFTPAYGAVAPTTVAHPFEVRFPRYLWGRSMRGAGAVRFTPEALEISGHREPHILFQVGIVLVVTYLPLLFFGFGLGIIPALLIAYYAGRTHVTLTLPYTALRIESVRGRLVTLRTQESPKVIIFAVASVDGERLYRELQPRFPAALGGWLG